MDRPVCMLPRSLAQRTCSGASARPGYHHLQHRRCPSERFRGVRQDHPAATPHESDSPGSAVRPRRCRRHPRGHGARARGYIPTSPEPFEPAAALQYVASGRTFVRAYAMINRAEERQSWSKQTGTPEASPLKDLTPPRERRGRVPAEGQAQQTKRHLASSSAWPSPSPALAHADEAPE
jgi:hypothetical protein